MLRSVLTAGSLMLFAASGLLACGAGDRYTARVDLLGQEMADQQARTQRLEARLDELQIQLSILARAVEERRQTKNRAEAGRPKAPDLAVVKIRPRAGQPAAKALHKAPANRSSRRTARIPGSATLPEVDPGEVVERLPVDRAAAGRPLTGGGGGRSEAERVATRERADAAAAAEAFGRAFDWYRKNRFGRAWVALSDFARKYPAHALASEALFYAGKAQMMLGQVVEAEQRFLNLVESYPKQPRSADALLMAGRCQERQGKLDAARGTYLQLVDAYPLSEQASEANRRLQSTR